MRLDAKSARRIVTGSLKAQYDEIREAMDTLFAGSKRGFPQKGNRFRRRIEEDIQKTFGDAFLGGGWHSRTYLAFIFEILGSNDGKPSQLAITAFSYNTRSDVEQIHELAWITMHAMERLLERRRDTDLIRLARDEFDVEFIKNLLFSANGPPLLPNEEFKVKTKNGWACGIVDPGYGIPTVRTWIHKPGGWPKTDSDSTQSPAD